jgi:hypothetical protein
MTDRASGRASLRGGGPKARHGERMGRQRSSFGDGMTHGRMDGSGRGRRPGGARRLLPLAAATLLGAAATDAETAPPLLAWITLEGGERGVAFRAMASAEDAAPIEYSLRVSRTGGGASSSTSQAGKARLPGGGEATALSTARVSLGAGATYRAELTVTGPEGASVRSTISSPVDGPP